VNRIGRGHAVAPSSVEPLTPTLWQIGDGEKEPVGANGDSRKIGIALADAMWELGSKASVNVCAGGAVC
jgi:hypothetical protein